MRKLMLLALTFGCHHDNSGQSGAPDMSVYSADMIDIRDDLAGLEAAICGMNSKTAQQVGLDLVFAVDNSASMDFNLKWQEVSAALQSFIQDPRFNGLGVGIQYFPGRAQCNVADYAVPSVPVAVLPGAAPALIASIQSRRMSGGTALVPALQGILQYAATVNPAGSSRRTVVVLATDGAPDNTCLPHDDAGAALNPIAVSAGIVQAAAQANPPIPTYVIGVGSDLTALNAIAQAGSGPSASAFLVDTTKDIESEFRDALDAIRKQALVCQFLIPDAAPGLHIDFNMVNVTFTNPDLMSQSQFVYVGDKADCGKAPGRGWYYDDVNNPTQVVLCDDSCQLVRDSDNGKIDIVFGCATVIP